MMISEEALYAAAPEAAEKFLSALPDREDCVHDFSPDFEARMATLLRRQRRRRHWRALLAAAAVLGAEPVVKCEAHKTAVAVSTVVIFGTLSMFIYPVMYRAGILDLDPEQMGLYTGATLHEVAHVVGAGNAMGKEISDAAIIVKMIRVMMLAPVLVVMSFMLARTAVNSVVNGGRNGGGVAPSRGKITIPWFAFGFLAVIGFNSLDLLPHAVVDGINQVDTFMLTMAMTALGTETSIEKFKKAGAKPFVLATILYVWLLAGGYLLAKYVPQLA